MTIEELRAKARCMIGSPTLRTQYAEDVAKGVVELLEAPEPCMWPKPEVVELKGGGKALAWEVFGSDVSADELRALIAMQLRALADLEQ